jgi:hypothetical protein
MPKDFLCNKIIDGVVCNENNPENFEPGRYSTCKKCRVRINREGKALKVSKVKTIEELNSDSTQKLITKINEIVHYVGELESKIEEIEIDNKFLKKEIEILNLKYENFNLKK